MELGAQRKKYLMNTLKHRVPRQKQVSLVKYNPDKRTLTYTPRHLQEQSKLITIMIWLKRPGCWNFQIFTLFLCHGCQLNIQFFQM